MDTPNDSNKPMLELVAGIVGAFVSNNHVAVADLPALIASVKGALGSAATQQAELTPEIAQPLVPAVPIKKSIGPDYLVCLEDGKQFKSLKRHLLTHYNLTPEAYRQKWGLPADYPMVSANYAAKRSELARSIGLGHTRKRNVDLPPVVEPKSEVTSPKPQNRREKKKSAEVAA